MEKLYGNPIHEWITRPIPEKLWHYTSLQGFMGIVDSNGIYTTDIRFLNDREEMVHAQDLVRQVVSELPEVDETGWPTRSLMQSTIDALINKGGILPALAQIFVASFSTAEDQLSQWRAYSRGTTGVSLGFDLKEIRPHPSTINGPIFAQCIYDNDKKKELISGAINRFLYSAIERWNLLKDKGYLESKFKEQIDESPNMSPQEVEERVTQSESDLIRKELVGSSLGLMTDVVKLGALLKHESFSEEQEWRLVLPVFNDGAQRTHKPSFRANATSLVPYREFDLTPNGGGSFPLTDVILGPGSEPVIGLDAAKGFLGSHGIHIEPRVSRAPFRPW